MQLRNINILSESQFKNLTEDEVKQDELYLVPFIPVTTINGEAPDDNGNYQLGGAASAGAYITATYSSGTNWYRKWSDGWIEQGGTTQNVGSDSTVTVSCITAFTTTNYNIVASQKSNSTKTDSTGMVLLYPTSTSSWRLHNGDNVSAPFMWYACGK